MSGATSQGSSGTSASGASLKYLCPSSGQWDTAHWGTLGSEQKRENVSFSVSCVSDLKWQMNVWKSGWFSWVWGGCKMCLCPSNGHLALSKFFLQFSFQRSLLTWSVSVWLADVRWLSNVSFISFLWSSFSLVRSTTIDVRSRFPIALRRCSVFRWVVGSSGFAPNAIKICAFSSEIFWNILISDWLSTYLKDISGVDEVESFWHSSVVLEGGTWKNYKNVGTGIWKGYERDMKEIWKGYERGMKIRKILEAPQLSSQIVSLKQKPILRLHDHVSARSYRARCNLRRKSWSWWQNFDKICQKQGIYQRPTIYQQMEGGARTFVFSLADFCTVQNNAKSA